MPDLGQHGAMPGMSAGLRMAEVHAYRGNPDQAFDWLAVARDRAVTERPLSGEGEILTELQISAFLGLLHDDPRWRAILADIS